MKQVESPRKRKPKDACRVRNCQVTDADRPMTFRGEPYCCDNHRKKLEKLQELESIRKD